MDSANVRVTGPEKNRRIFHWIVAAAFIALFITGLIVFVPALSGLAAGGWTRLIHRVAAVILVGAPTVYALTHTADARQWLREIRLWNKSQATVANGSSNWKRIHKLLITIGLVLFIATGIIQWFLKGIVPSELFQWSLSLHDIIFFSAGLVLIYHVYFEFNWWLWKRRYCRNCSPVYCADVCPTRALTRSLDGTIEYRPQRCNNCRLCMEYCRRNSYHKKAKKPSVAEYQDSPAYEKTAGT
jgi:cytochrome b subunit of formate dehydrogenase